MAAGELSMPTLIPPEATCSSTLDWLDPPPLSPGPAVIDVMPFGGLVQPILAPSVASNLPFAAPAAFRFPRDTVPAPICAELSDPVICAAGSAAVEATVAARNA